jgi:xylulose-5-phosphate/fructose-6-phosphate phosphoketolase
VVPTLELLAAAKLLRRYMPGLRVRVVNVVDLMTLQPESEHPHGLNDDEFDAIFTTDRPIIFAFHGYPWLLHRLMYRRRGHPNLHVRGYKEEGTTTTPFDMTVLNNIDRFDLVIDVMRRVPELRNDAAAAALIEFCEARLAEHREYVVEYGDDMPDVRDWRWGS